MEKLASSVTESNAVASMDFVNLHSKIKRIIYEYLFSGLVLGFVGPASPALQKRGFPAILHSNRLLRQEALPIFYSLATFSFDAFDGDSMRRPFDFVDPTTSPQNRVFKRIQHASITYKSSQDTGAWADDLSEFCCSALTSMKRFRFHYDIHPRHLKDRKTEIESRYRFKIDPAWDYRSGYTDPYIDQRRVFLRERLLCRQIYTLANDLEEVGSLISEIRFCDFAIIFRHVRDKFVIVDDDGGELVRLPGISCVALLNMENELGLLEEGGTFGDQIKVEDKEDKDIRAAWLWELKTYLGLVPKDYWTLNEHGSGF